MRVCVLACLLLVVGTVADQGVNLYAHRQRLRQAHHSPAAEVQILAQTDEDVEKQPVDLKKAPEVYSSVSVPVPVPASAPVVSTQTKAPSTFAGTIGGQVLSCQQFNGQTICLPANNAAPAVPVQDSNMLAASANHATEVLLSELRAKLETEQITAKNSVEMAKEMVQEVRDETKKIVQEAELEARTQREENTKLRDQIVKLEEELQKRPPVPVAISRPTQEHDTQQLLQLGSGLDKQEELKNALEEYEQLKNEYENLD
eukprot:c8129_g1_i2.p1 GENE.c8129_g1_i2~~c8129_g1_i2.p1  ORF type:complete len:272 (+),score=83.95 c8129_g1_i2:40-816(+)